MSAQREDISFHCKGTPIAGWLYPATGPSAPARGTPGPAVVLGHGLGGVKEMGLDRYAEVFSKAGYACVVFDYRHFGASGGVPRQLLDINKQLEDWHAALAYARSRKDVIDPERIAIFGSSFGGGHVLEVAKADKRVKAVISQCPFTHGLASALCTGFTVAPFLAFHTLRDMLFGAADGDKNGQVITVPLAGKPGSVACLNGPDAYDGYLGLLPKGAEPGKDTRFVNGASARLIPRLLLYYPGRAAAHVDAPIFFAICGRDSCAPAKQTLAYARNAKNKKEGVVRLYEDFGHFSIYQGEQFDIATKDYVDFLTSRLPPRAKL